MTDVYVVGTGMTRFDNYGSGFGIPLAAEASVAALRDAGITFADVDILYAGAANPNSPRGVFVARELGLTGLPVQHVSNASATGLAAAHEAITAIESGRADVALVIGYDSPDTDVKRKTSSLPRGIIRRQCHSRCGHGNEWRSTGLGPSTWPWWRPRTGTTHGPIHSRLARHPSR